MKPPKLTEAGLPHAQRPPCIFVYGTLMSGLGAAAPVRLASLGPLLGSATLPGALLYDLGDYPGLILAPLANAVHGEVYQLTDPARAWPLLDRYEGYGADGFAPDEPRAHSADLYLPIAVDVLMSRDGAPQLATTYVYNWPLTDATLIPHGDYRRYLAER